MYTLRVIIFKSVSIIKSVLCLELYCVLGKASDTGDWGASRVGRSVTEFWCQKWDWTDLCISGRVRGQTEAWYNSYSE